MNLKHSAQPAVASALALGISGVDGIARFGPTRYVNLPTFQVDGYTVHQFIHRYNAYCPPFRMTERTIELALADMFLREVGTRNVSEIGAVTPYYWPWRVPVVVDPTDAHEQVTDRLGWMEWEPSGDALLSISTFEHIGAGEYGLEANPRETRAAVDKLLSLDMSFLVTYPAGYNAGLDECVRALAPSTPNLRVMAWHRGKRGNAWRQIDFADTTPAMESYGPTWANTLVALYRGPDDLWARGAVAEASKPA